MGKDNNNKINCSLCNSKLTYQCVTNSLCFNRINVMNCSSNSCPLDNSCLSDNNNNNNNSSSIKYCNIDNDNNNMVSLSNVTDAGTYPIPPVKENQHRVWEMPGSVWLQDVSRGDVPYVVANLVMVGKPREAMRKEEERKGAEMNRN
ncbi:hypothetical protein TKK_0000294 [Trichogramma kaykai]